MLKGFKMVKATFLVSMILLVSLLAVATPASAALINFNSYIDLQYDPEYLNQEIEINQVVTVPLTVKYSTDVDANYLSIIPGALWMLKNSIIYGSAMPQQTIHFRIINEPAWANIYFSTPDQDIDMPDSSQPEEEVNVQLFISPLREAPSEPFNIQFTVEVEEKGLVQGKLETYNIVFTPAYLPYLTVTPQEPTRIVAPREAVNIPIEVTNNANYYSIIRHQIGNLSGDWQPIINPATFSLAPGDTQTVILSVTPPYNFGWHDEVQTIRVDFTAEPEGGGSAGPSYPAYVKLNNRGFSTPGFEGSIGLIAVALVAGVIMLRKRKT